MSKTMEQLLASDKPEDQELVEALWLTGGDPNLNPDDLKVGPLDEPDGRPRRPARALPATMLILAEDHNGLAGLRGSRSVGVSHILRCSERPSVYIRWANRDD